MLSLYFWFIFSDQNILAVQKHDEEYQECITFDLKNEKNERFIYLH